MIEKLLWLKEYAKWEIAALSNNPMFAFLQRKAGAASLQGKGKGQMEYLI